MIAYEQIKLIATGFLDYYTVMQCVTSPQETFDEWASRQGKDLMDGLQMLIPQNWRTCQCDGCKNYRAEKLRAIAPMPNVEQPLNTSPVSPDKQIDRSTDRHEALVREIAKEMSAERNKQLWGGLSDANKKAAISYHTPAARIAVKRMADSYIEGYMSNCDDDEQEGIDLWMNNAKAECEERGLIPGKEGGQDEKA